MKKILHISKYYFPFHGGIERTARDCVLALKDIYQQKIICFNHRPGDDKDIVDGIEVIRAGCIGKISSQSLSLTYSRLLRKTIDEFEPDMIVFHYPNPFVAHYLLKYVNRNTKLIIYWHLDIVRQKMLKLFFVRQNKRLIARACKILATSPNYVKGSPWLNAASEKCLIVPSCVNVNRFVRSPETIHLEEKIRRDNSEHIICFAIGRHTEYKGFSYLIQASRLLDDRFRIYIAGEGDITNELKREAKGDEKIIFLGILSDTELEAYMSAMDIFCFPSVTKNEAFGLTLAEAMYHGKPSVTFTIEGSGVNYVSLNNVTGLEVPNKDIQSYAKALECLVDNPGLREKYGKAAQKRILEYFTDDIFIKRMRSEIGLIAQEI